MKSVDDNIRIFVTTINILPRAENEIKKGYKYIRDFLKRSQKTQDTKMPLLGIAVVVNRFETKSLP